MLTFPRHTLFRSRLSGLSILAAACIAATGPVLGQSAVPVRASVAEPETPQGGSQWGLGLGVSSAQQPYRGVDRDTTGIPLIYFENRWVRLLGPQLEVKLGAWAPAAGHELKFGLRLQYADDGYEADDAPFLDGMAERKDGFWGGVAATWSSPLGDLSAEWRHDVSSHSEGQHLQLTAERRFRLGELALTPRLRARWLDDKAVDYYFGVSPAEARIGRPAYEGTSTTNVEAGLRVDYRLAPQQSLFLDLSATQLGSEIKDSPLVDRSSVSRVTLGYLYRF